MASFSEQAVLSVIDKSTKPINEINKALRSLQKTAASIKSQKIDLGNLNKVSGDVRRLTGELAKLKGASSGVRLNVNTGQLSAAARQVAALRAQAQRPLAMRIGAGVVGGLGAHSAASGIARATREGNRDVDIGETSLALKELTKDQRKVVDDQIKAISDAQAGRTGGAMFNRGTITQQVSEMLGTVKIGAAKTPEDFLKRAEQARFLADQNLELAGTFVKLGMDSAQAQEEAIKFGKAVEMQGQIYDKATGNINVQKAAEQYDNIRRLLPMIGKEATGSNYLALMKFLQSSKFSLSPEATAMAMANFEEMSTQAAVGLNQLISTTGANTKKFALEEQRRLGLITTTLVPKEKAGKRTVKEVAGVLPEDKAKKLRETPQKYFDEDVIPALKRDLMTATKTRKALTDAQAEDKLNDPAWVTGQVNKMWGDRTARNMAALMILKRNEQKQVWEDFRSRQGTVDKQREGTAYSVIGATTAVSNQFRGLMGEAVRAVAPALVPALGAASEGMRQIADLTAKAQGGDKDAQSKLAGGAAAVALAGYFGAPAIKAVSGPVAEVLAQVAKPLGLVAGMTAAASHDPGTSGMGFAATALIGAAEALSGAASDLSKAGGGTGIAPGGESKGKSPPGKTPEIPKKGIPWWLLALGRAGGAGLLAAPFLSGSEPSAEWANATPDERQRLYARDAAKYQLHVAKEQLKALDEGRTTLPGKQEKRSVLQGAALDSARLLEKRNELTTSIDSLTKEVSRLSVEGAKVKPAGELKSSDWIELNRSLKQFKPGEIKWPDGTPTTAPPTPKWPEGAVPAPSWITDMKASLETSGTPLTAAATSLAASTSALPAEMFSASTTFASTFSTGSSLFNTTFAAGATAIAGAGTSAADAMAGRMPGLGATLGNAAGDAIAARVSGLSINVNANVNSGPNTGAQKAD